MTDHITLPRAVVDGALACLVEECIGDVFYAETVAALRAALAEQEQVRDQSDFGTWFCRLGKLADAYHETGRTHPARFKARGELMAHALDAVIGWRARSVLEQQQSARQPLTDDQRGGLVMEHLGPAALTGGTMSVYEAFLAGLSAAERAHGIKEAK